MRLALLSALACLMPFSISAQSRIPQERIRISGLENYAIPGSTITRTEDSFIEVTSNTSQEVTAIPQFKRHLVGDLLGAQDGFVTLRIGAQRIVRVPVDSIRTLEVSRGRPSKARALLIGIGAGIGVTLAAAAITFKSCGLDCGGGALIVAAGIGAGVATAAALTRERWQRMPISWLAPRAGANLIGFYIRGAIA